jgi:TonB family protein
MMAAREQTLGEQGKMHAEEIVLAAEGSALTLEEHLAALRAERPRVFWLGLTFALLVHALFIIGIGRSTNRTLGKEDGAADAIAVEIVDGATLKDSMAPPAPPASASPAKPMPQEQPQQPQQAQPEVPPTPPTPPEVAAQPPPPTPPDAKAAEQALPEDFADTLSALQETPADQEKPKKAPEAEKPVPKQAEKQPPKPKQPQQQQAKPKPPQKRTQTSALDLSLPTDDGPDSDEGGAGSAVQRPPGITRSGENDEFARNVIRALQKTMPRERANGRVTVRIVLSENGSRADVKLLKSGGNPDLDFNVMFAARQTAYPFPPGNSTLVDRTFTVTYIYR